MYLPLNVADYVDSKYKVEEVEENIESYQDTPLMYRIKNERRMQYAKELYAEVMAKLDVKRIVRESVDYYVPYEGIVELINKGLIKRVIAKETTLFTVKTEQADAMVAATVVDSPTDK